ncbi:MAG: type I DNA topoisomerase [Candidatus Cryptobacteroides sp.]|nr:type I DNA topoisomerase [Candidatus Cryptobacteroides sp.]
MADKKKATAENLVIVESPAKAGTIQKFLGEGFIVKPSFGHIRDLHERDLSIDIEKGFVPEYEVPSDKKKVVSELKKLASGAETVWLASDEDREGEAISWHLYETLGLKKENTKRIVFHEITKNAILHAIETPRDIDMNLVDAQQARRVLDRLVGFELSPVLWRKVQPKLSAGRVQSVALRLIVDREREILSFKRSSFYRIEALFHPENFPAGAYLKAVLDRKFTDRDSAEAFLRSCTGARFSVLSVDKKEGTRVPAAPFTTSTLQQEASRKLHMSVSTTMSVAQKLYESGLITYMRTDSTNLSTLALAASRDFVTAEYGAEYSRTRNYKTRAAGAQEAHEAIRPTYIDRTAISGTPQEQRLYELIWRRTVASQMADAKVLRTDIRIGAEGIEGQFVAQSSEVLFDGFLRLYSEGRDDETQDEEEAILPGIASGMKLDWEQMKAECRFTSAPPRYSEATLVKKLEELGIGRPSTYAPTITTLTKARGYVVKGDKSGSVEKVTDLLLSKDGIKTEQRSETVGAEKSKLLPQDIGIIVTDFLVKNFSDILSYDFTANVEKEFDSIAEGQLSWNKVIADFYSPFHKTVEDSLSNREYSHVSRELGVDPSDGQPVVAKFGQYGPYVQKGEGENRKFANLAPGQIIESLTLEDALKLFSLPRTVGEHEGIPVVCTSGRFGPYIKYGDRNVSLPRKSNPLTITLAECVEIIEAAGTAKTREVLAEFGDIQVINGNYGPYIKYDGGNYKIPAGKDAKALTEQDCREIIASTKPSGKRRTRK